MLALTVNPTERNLATIAAAERATLAELRALSMAAGASLRVHCDDAAQLSLDAYAEGTQLEVAAQWFTCEACA